MWWIGFLLIAGCILLCGIVVLTAVMAGGRVQIRDEDEQDDDFTQQFPDQITTHFPEYSIILPAQKSN